MPEETRQYIAAVFARNKVTARHLRHMMILRWILWSEGNEENAIPGYAECPSDKGEGYPNGWSVSSFNKIAKSANTAPVSLGRIAKTSSH